MKTHKIIISTLALAMGAALAGSVSGTVAWFQYSTRAQAAYIGASAHCSELLQVSIDDGANWKTELTSSDVNTAITAANKKIIPITSGAQAKDAALGETFYANPIYQISAGSYSADTWQVADAINYVQFTLKFRVTDVKENLTTKLAKDVFLTNLTIQDVTSGVDLSDAVRVHFAATNNMLFAKNATSTDVCGALDLNSDGDYDMSEGYEWDDRTELVYGTADAKQTSYAANDTTVVATDTNGTLSNGKKLGSTASDADLSVTVTIWLEGWQKLAKSPAGNKDYTSAENPGPSAVWDSTNYVGKQFRVGMRFAVPLHDNANE